MMSFVTLQATIRSRLVLTLNTASHTIFLYATTMVPIPTTMLTIGCKTSGLLNILGLSPWWTTSLVMVVQLVLNSIPSGLDFL